MTPTIISGDVLLFVSVDSSTITTVSLRVRRELEHLQQRRRLRQHEKNSAGAKPAAEGKWKTGTQTLLQSPSSNDCRLTSCLLVPAAVNTGILVVNEASITEP